MGEEHVYWQRMLKVSRAMALIGFFGLLVLALMTTLDIGVALAVQCADPWRQ